MMQLSKFSLLILTISCCSLIFNSCTQKNDAVTFDIQGHRGCRGLMPENSIDGFLKAVEMGVTTLEMDVVISKDLKVVVSHEPYISSEICLHKNGDSLSANIGERNMYEMTYAEITEFDCGSLKSEKFPHQVTQPATKPLLSAVLDKCEEFAQSLERPLPYYNIEIKSIYQYDNEFHPEPPVFSELLMKEIQQANIEDRVIIQSFDIRPLRYISEKYPNIKLAYLTENQLSHLHNLQKLGFELDIYSPQYEYISQKMIDDLHERNIAIIPWTVNERMKMVELIEMNVDGIISDYPNILIEVVDSLKSI